MAKNVKDTEAKFGPELNFASSEAYNRLRMNLSFALPEKTGGKVIGVTSAVPQDGKSYTVINLAYALAKNGNRVLIVDGDMRRPTMAIRLGLPSKPGLSNMLIKQVDNAIMPVPIHSNMYALVAGTIPPNPSELIGIPEMKNLLDRFSKQFDYVLVDLPPIDSVSDPIVVSRFVDGMVIVVKHGHTQKRDIAEAMRQLEFSGARVLGFVYNNFSKRQNRRYKRKYDDYDSPNAANDASKKEKKEKKEKENRAVRETREKNKKVINKKIKSFHSTEERNNENS